MKLFTALLASAMLLSAAPAFAVNNSNNSSSSGGDLITAENPDSVLAALKTLGYAGKLEKLKSGRTSITVTISGLTTYVDFYDCADDLTDCFTLLFNATLDLSDGTNLDKANEWNSKQITGRVWLDDQKDPTLDYSVTTSDGIPAEAFAQNLKLWDRKIGDFKDFFNF